MAITMRAASITLCLMLAAVGVGAAQQQTAEPSFGYLQDYTFEKVVATREVHDAHENGPIGLVSYVYRPVKYDRHEVVIMSHGSTGGQKSAPSEPIPTNRDVVQFFIKRGYTLVAVNRRGAGESSGTYVEECPGFSHTCTPSQQSDLFASSLASALEDTDAAIRQVVYGKLTPPGAPVILAGQSRGGFLSLAFAGAHPEMVKAVVNFVGGWNSITAVNSTDENAKRVRLADAELSQIAKRYHGPTLWIYGSRDPNYSEAVTRAWFKSFIDAGGCGKFLFAERHDLPSGHMMMSLPSLWASTLESLLQDPAAFCSSTAYTPPPRSR